MERSKETTVTITIAELAERERANSEAAAQEIITALKGTTETTNLTQPKVSSPAPDEIQAIQGIQILTNPAIVNYGKRVDDPKEAKTWKDKTDKRKADKRKGDKKH